MSNFDDDIDKNNIIRVNFACDRDEWDMLDYNINTTKSRFLRDIIKRVNNAGSDLDVLYKEMVIKRNELRLSELEIEDLKARIDELEKARVKRDIEVI